MLVAGPDAEVATVRRVFREYAVHGLKVNAIVGGLNADHAPAPRGGPWTKIRILRLLQNEMYAGVLLIGRYRTRLRRPCKVSPDAALRLPGACPALVSPALYEIAQRTCGASRTIRRIRPCWPSCAGSGPSMDGSRTGSSRRIRTPIRSAPTPSGSGA